jgi:hypothetical protein
MIRGFSMRSLRAKDGLTGLGNPGLKPGRRPRRSLPSVEAMEDRTLLSVKFYFNFSQDRNLFFNTTEKLDLLDKAGRILTDRLDDSLSAIRPGGKNSWTARFLNPATGAITDFKNVSIPEGTIFVYAGGRDLPSDKLAVGAAGTYSSISGPSSWQNTVKTRGQSGVNNGTDVAPWGGSITFNTRGVNWFTGTTTSGLKSGMTDFLSVAVHELGHVLGFNTDNPSWKRWISNGKFNGPKAKMAGNGPVSLSPDQSHWAEGTRSDEVETAMDPSLTEGTRKLFSRLDFAALQDIGWSVRTTNDTLYAASHVLTHIPNPVFGTSDYSQGNGSIDQSRDVDIYRIYVGAGSKLTIGVTAWRGGKKVNTHLRLYDLSGGVLASANQGGTGGTDSITDFAISRSDYYFVAISSVDNRGYDPTRFNSGRGGPTGDYEFSIRASSF